MLLQLLLMMVVVRSQKTALWSWFADRQKKKKIPLSTLEEVDMDLC